MGYGKPQVFGRKDLLTAGTYGRIRNNARLLERSLVFEHLVSGAHNTPLIPRTLGTVLVSAGPVYSLSGFNSDASLGTGHNPSAGTCVLTLAPDRYEKDGGVIQTQSAGVDGDTRPELVSARWFDDRRIQVFTSYWDGAAWSAAGSDSAFHAAVHGRTLARAAPLDFGAPLQGGVNGLRISNTNKLIQSSADLQAALDVEHTSGVHDVREVPKAWVRGHYNGATFDIADQECSATFDAGKFRSLDLPSAGVINVNFEGQLASTGYQVFVNVHATDAANYVCCAPVDARSKTGFVLYFWLRGVNGALSPPPETWTLGLAVDFDVWVHDDH